MSKSTWVYKSWLAAQIKTNVQTIFIGTLVTELCRGLGLEAKLEREKVDTRMEQSSDTSN